MAFDSNQKLGRLPWFNVQGEARKPYIIGIAGGSASGKTSVAKVILKGIPWVALLSMDNFYKTLSQAEMDLAHQNKYNFDSPTSFDYEKLFEVLQALKKGAKAEIPIYDFKTHSRLADKTTTVYGANVIIFEGIFALWDKNVRDLMDLKIFVDTDADVRLARRLRRDISERGRDIHGVLQQYNTFVKPAFDDFIYPTIKFADIVIPRGSDNIVAIDLVTKHVNRQLNERGLSLRSQLASLSLKEIPPTVKVHPSSPQLEAIFTKLRNRDTIRGDYVFFADRLMRLTVEFALAELPFDDVTITTPTGSEYHGASLTKKLCAVSILRSGEAMERALRKVILGIPIGKILIQADGLTAEPQLHYCKLPHNVQECHVLLADAICATGSAAMMAVRVLLDHNVPEDHILYIAALSAPQGIAALTRAFPKVRIITAKIDQGLNSELQILPGIGFFGARYFSG